MRERLSLHGLFTQEQADKMLGWCADATIKKRFGRWMVVWLLRSADCSPQLIRVFGPFASYGSARMFRRAMTALAKG